MKNKDILNMPKKHKLDNPSIKVHLRRKFVEEHKDGLSPQKMSHATFGEC